MNRPPDTPQRRIGVRVRRFRKVSGNEQRVSAS